MQKIKKGANTFSQHRMWQSYDDCLTLSVSITLVFCSDRPSEWCKENWIHWRALKSAFSVETQLQEILHRLQQVQQCRMWCIHALLNDSYYCKHHFNTEFCLFIISCQIMLASYVNVIVWHLHITVVRTAALLFINVIYSFCSVCRHTALLTVKINLCACTLSLPRREISL